MFNSSWGFTKNSSEMRATEEEELLFRNGTALEHKITMKRSHENVMRFYPTSVTN